MHQILFRLGLRPIPRAGGAHGAPPDLLDGFKGPTSKGREGEGEQGAGGEEMVFSLYLTIHGLRKGPGKFLTGVLENPGFFCR